jgi:tetratricopeptide (TPR) repeat protein
LADDPQAPGASPEDTLAMFRLGLQIHRQGRLAEAEAVYNEVLQRSPDTPDALHLKGLIRLQQGQAEEARELIAQAIALQPRSAAMHVNHGNALMALKRTQEALTAYDSASMLPDAPAELHRLRGDALQALGRLPEALAAYTRAVAARPGDAVAQFNRANQLRYLRRIDEAVAAYGEALALDPNLAVAHHNRAVCRLLAGDWEGGLEEYEWRKLAPDFDDPRYRLQPGWTGDQDLAGQRLFVFAELFLGDVIQMARYLPLAAARGAEVVLAAPRALHGLLSTLPAPVELIEGEATPERFDLACPLMSLPHRFRTRPDSAPAEVPYLSAEPGRAARWRERLGEEGFKIGVCWQGSTAAYAAPMQRSFPLAALAPLARPAGVRLVSLQKHDGLDQLANLPEGMAVETLGPDFDAGGDAFLDTAAVMAGLDLVVTADTAVAHVAGALGVPTWLALPFLPDWRWGLEGETTPWYPSFRLFRQARPGEWTDVFARMAAELEGLVHA